MMAKNVRVEWRQGEDGLGNVYIFNPNPSPTREEPAMKQAEFDIPLLDGIFIQSLGRAKRQIILTGLLIAKPRSFENLEDQRDALVNGLSTGVGQLHFISLNSLSNQRHIFYVGRLSPDGVVFSEQTNPLYLDYTLRVVCANPFDGVGSGNYFSRIDTTISSSARVA